MLTCAISNLHIKEEDICISFSFDKDIQTFSDLYMKTNMFLYYLKEYPSKLKTYKERIKLYGEINQKYDNKFDLEKIHIPKKPIKFWNINDFGRADEIFTDIDVFYCHVWVIEYIMGFNINRLLIEETELMTNLISKLNLYRLNIFGGSLIGRNYLTNEEIQFKIKFNNEINKYLKTLLI